MSDKPSIIIAPSMTPSAELIKLAQEFVDKFAILEILQDVALILHLDKKSEAYYLVCHLSGEEIGTFADIDAVLDADDDEYKLNRDLSVDKYAYKVMEAHAKQGRSFEDLVIEYDKQYRSDIPLKVYGGQHRIQAIKAAIDAGVSVHHGLRVYFKLSRDQKIEIATVNNTSIAVPNDLLDRIQEDQLGSELRDWCQKVGLLASGENFAERSSEDKPTVRAARTLIVNYYKGKESLINPAKFYQPILSSSGPGVDEEYKKYRDSIDWNDPELIRMGLEFAKLNNLQITSIRRKKKGGNAGYARKALSFAVIASWGFASGLFQRHAFLLDNHYALGNGISPSTDPLNADSLSKARLKGVDKDNYRGLGTRNDPKELGRMFQLFLLQAEQGKGIDKELANTAIKYYEGRRMTHEADEDVKKGT